MIEPAHLVQRRTKRPIQCRRRTNPCSGRDIGRSISVAGSICGVPSSFRAAINCSSAHASPTVSGRKASSCGIARCCHLARYCVLLRQISELEQVKLRNLQRLDTKSAIPRR